jgi:hypothetical protein
MLEAGAAIQQPLLAMVAMLQQALLSIEWKVGHFTNHSSPL